MIVYNSRTAATGSIESKYLTDSGHNFEGSVLTNGDHECQELIRLLKMGEFVIPKEVDEKNLIRLELLKNKFSTSHIDLTIIPTSDCNFACIYCYEKDFISDQYISKENQEALLNFISKKVPFVFSLHITWYGGEPLLALSTIETLTKQILDICSKHNVQYSASMITNGYLLSKTTLEILKEIMVKDIQITLDGLAKKHDQRRPLKNSNGTFEQIIRNLINGQGLLPESVKLRINVDENNTGEVDDLLDFLKIKGLIGHVSPYLGKIENHDDCYVEQLCLSESKYMKFAINFAERVNYSLQDLHPKPIYNFCGADMLNSYTVNSDGFLYKCWEDLGKTEKIIGHIQDESFYNAGVFFDYLLYDPFNDANCSKCKYLPLCLGGCPNKRDRDPGEKCARVHEHLRSYINIESQKW